MSLNSELNAIISGLPEELIEQIMLNLDEDTLEHIYATNNQKLKRIITPIVMKNRQETEMFNSEVDGYDEYEYEEKYDNPTANFLNSQYDLLIGLGASHQKALITIVRNLTNRNYNGKNMTPIEFLDSKKFNYNSRGNYKGDVGNEYLIHYACEYRYFSLMEQLCNRNVNLNKITKPPAEFNVIELLIIGHGYGDERIDFSKCLNLLLSKGVIMSRERFTQFSQKFDINIDKLKPSVKNLLAQHNII